MIYDSGAWREEGNEKVLGMEWIDYSVFGKWPAMGHRPADLSPSIGVGSPENGRGSSCAITGPVKKMQQVIRRYRERGVSTALVIAELHFVNARSQQLHNCANLAASKTLFRDVLDESDGR
jgi:hypothetical protein